MPNIDYHKRKIEQTEYALAYAKQLPVTPILLEIHYLEFLPSSPSYYLIDCGIPTPISRLNSTKANYEVKMIMLPNRQVIFQWK